MSTEAAPTAPTQEVFVPSPGPTGDYPSHIEPNDDTTGKTSFRDAMKQAGLDPDAGAPTPIGQQPKKEPVARKEANNELPDVVLHGVKAPSKEVKKTDEYQPSEEDLKLLEERPQGQIKHDHFERIQKAANFKIKAEQARVAEYEAKLKDFESRPKAEPLDEASKARLTEYEQKVKDRDELLARIAYEQTDDFKARFTTREGKIKEGLRGELKGLGVDEDLVDTLLHTRGTKRYKALDELDISESARVALTTKLVQYDDLQADKAEALSASSKNLTEWQAQQKGQAEKAEKTRMDEENRIFMQVSEEMAKEHEMFAEIPGNEDWNKKISARRDEALEYLNGTSKSFKDLSRIVHYGVAAQDQHDMIVVPLRKHVAKLQEQLSRMTTASPGLTPSGPKAPAPKALSPELQAMETFRAEMGKAANQGFQP